MKKKKKLKHNSFQLTNKLTNKQVRVLYNYISIVQFVVCVRASERAFSWWWNHDDDDFCAFESARFIGTQHSTHITIWLVCIFAPFDWVNVARCVSQMTFIRMDSFVSFSVRVFSTLVFKAHCAHTFVHIYCHIFSLSRFSCRGGRVHSHTHNDYAWIITILECFSFVCVCIKKRKSLTHTFECWQNNRRKVIIRILEQIQNVWQFDSEMCFPTTCIRYELR